MSSNGTPKKEKREKTEAVAGPAGAVLACGCRAVFQPGSDDSPLLVVIDRKSESCGLSLHVAGLPVYDRRAAMRPSTRVGPPLQPDYEDG